MSGGHFDYNQYRINDMVDKIKRLIKNNNVKDEWGACYNFSEETIKEFEKAIEVLEKASVYAQRIDWLVCGDDGEDTFHERLKEELEKETICPKKKMN